MRYLFFTIIVMDILSGAEVDIFVPSFPDLQNQFKLSTFMVELLLSVNLAANCITALVVGNLGDKFGRRVTIIYSLLIFVIGSVICFITNSYSFLLLGRVLQGIGITGPSILSFVLISDNYPLSKQPQLMGIINGIVTFAMAFAPVIGSYVNLFFNWRANFFVLLIMGVFSLILSYLFIPKDIAKPKIKISLKEYKNLLKSKKINYYILTMCFLAMPYYLFMGLAPILYLKDLGVSLKEFGFHQGAWAMTAAIFSLFSAKLLKIYGTKRCFLFSMVLLIIFLVICTILTTQNVASPVLITLGMQVFCLGVIFPFNILYPLLMNSYPEAKSRITAIFTFIKLTTITILIQIVSYFHSNNFTTIGIALLISTMGGLLCCYNLYSKQHIFNEIENS